MTGEKRFIKECTDVEKAVEFEQKVAGTRISKIQVEFLAAYSISKALYNVKSDRYRVYIRLRPCGTQIALSVVVWGKTSQEAYNEARNRIQKGVL